MSEARRKEIHEELERERAELQRMRGERAALKESILHTEGYIEDLETELAEMEPTDE